MAERRSHQQSAVHSSADERQELQLQAWIRMALLPGVCVGEYDLEGMFLVLQKRQLKKVVVEFEQLATT